MNRIKLIKRREEVRRIACQRLVRLGEEHSTEMHVIFTSTTFSMKPKIHGIFI